jgi:GT2 family glycosyltransferase
MQSPVSVVIPAYNGAQYIVSCLESVFAQSLLPREIVVVDDGSTDHTVAIVEDVHSPVPLLLLQLGSNSGGPAGPMTTGFSVCTAPLVATLDQDDRMAPDRLRMQVEALTNHPDAAAAIGLLTKIDADGNPCPGDFAEESRVRLDEIPYREGVACRLLDPAGTYVHVLSQGTLTVASSTTFRRSAWLAAGGFGMHLRVAWDCDISLKLTAVGPLAYIPEVIGEYRLHGANTSAQGTTTLREVLKVKEGHVNHPLHAIDLMGLRAELRDGFFGLAYAESNRGNLTAAWRALTAARRHGLPVAGTVIQAGKSVARAARARGRT